MAQKIQVLLIDDLSGETAQETVTFSLDGASYEIDLTTDHAAELRANLATWIKHARRVSNRGVAKRGRPVQNLSNANVVRKWAVANGYNVSERGRIAAEIQDAYNAAN